MKRAGEIIDVEPVPAARRFVRLRRDLDTSQAEVDRLKADLERLRRIDLRREPGRR